MLQITAPDTHRGQNQTIGANNTNQWRSLTFIERIAEQTWSTVRIRTYTSLLGNLVVSIASNTPFFHLTGSRESRFFPVIFPKLRCRSQLFACLYRRLPGLGPLKS